MNSEKLVQTYNGTVEWGVRGNYFKLLTAAFAADVKLFLGGREVLRAIAAPAGYYQRIDFDRVQITTPVNELIEWLYAPEEGGVDRLAGEVSVVDGGKARTLAGQAFLGSASVAAVAANLPHLQIKNPTGSGKRHVIRQLVIGSSLASLITVFRYDTDLTTLLAAVPSKNIGGAALAAQMRSQVNAVALGTGTCLAREYAQATVTAPVLVLGEPIILTPGIGIVIVGGTPNCDMVSTFEGIEEDNV